MTSKGGLTVGAVLVALALLGTGSTAQAGLSKRYEAYQACLAQATTQSERNQCRWQLDSGGRGR